MVQAFAGPGHPRAGRGRGGHGVGEGAVPAAVARARRRIRAVLAVVTGLPRVVGGLLVCLLVVGAVPAAPALAADASPDAEYYVSTVTQLRPAVPGLQVQVDAAGRISVVNHTDQAVVVTGYAGEDYLRIGPAGAEENTASLSSAINARQGQDQLPLRAGGGAADRRPAHWVKRSDQPAYSWRDYRVMWTGGQRPPIVLQDPHGTHTVSSWGLNLRVGATPVLVLGEVRWTGTPWLDPGWTVALGLLLTLVLAAVLIVVLRRRRHNRRGTGRRAGTRPGAAPDGTGRRVARATRPTPVPMTGPHG